MTEGDLYEKVAFGPLALAATTLGRGVAARAAGTAARGVGSFLWQGAKSLAGMGTQGPLQGAARAGRAVGTGANAVNTAMGMGQMAKEIIRPNPPPSPNSANTQATAFKAGSLQARVEKLAFGPTNALNIASYLSMIGAEALPHDHPWHARLEALGLGGLATSTAANMISTPDEELKPGAKDLAGLGLFASALHDRMKHAAHADAEFLALAGQAGPDAARAFAHRLGSAEKDMSHLTRAGATNKVATLGLAFSGAAGFLPEAAGYALGKSHRYTPEEAAAVRDTPYNLWASFLPGYHGYFFGTKVRASEGDRPDVFDHAGATPRIRDLRRALAGYLDGAADTLRAGSR